MVVHQEEATSLRSRLRLRLNERLKGERLKVKG